MEKAMTALGDRYWGTVPQKEQYYQVLESGTVKASQGWGRQGLFTEFSISRCSLALFLCDHYSYFLGPEMDNVIKNDVTFWQALPACYPTTSLGWGTPTAYYAAFLIRAGKGRTKQWWNAGWGRLQRQKIASITAELHRSKQTGGHHVEWSLPLLKVP